MCIRSRQVGLLRGKRNRCLHCGMPALYGSALYFKTQELDLDENSTGATLTGDTTDAKHIQGTDSVNIVPKDK